jgi:hypothetical protein
MDRIYRYFDSLGITSAAKIAALDTGFDHEHRMIRGSRGRIYSSNFFDPKSDDPILDSSRPDELRICPDRNGHGTFIAGLLVEMTGGRKGRTKLYLGKVTDGFTSLSHLRNIEAIAAVSTPSRPNQLHHLKC